MVICSMMDLNSAMAIKRDMLIWKSCICGTVLTPTSRSICAQNHTINLFHLALFHLMWNTLFWDVISVCVCGSCAWSLWERFVCGLSCAVLFTWWIIVFITYPTDPHKKYIYMCILLAFILLYFPRIIFILLSTLCLCA